MDVATWRGSYIQSFPGDKYRDGPETVFYFLSRIHHLAKATIAKWNILLYRIYRDMYFSLPIRTYIFTFCCNFM